ncbi:helix-turn-helix transcriptional regulator [Comamonas composti]|uniref:helix-turn-helix transcriptional regulator n=1 Tax=Comamonas composti TaxID=408558 RepID=UPI00041356D3
MENSDTPTADRLLQRLKTQGPTTTAEMAQALGLTVEATRQQIQKLVAQGWLAGELQASATAGRPRQRWFLTSAGHQRFPDAHAQLSVQLIQQVRQVFGEPGLEQLIARREAEMLDSYRQRCHARSLGRRLEQLAAVRTEEGYMARLEADGRSWLLIEDHCPICAAAQACQNFCRSELQIFQAIAGPGARVQREQHLLADGSRCVYRIEPMTQA